MWLSEMIILLSTIIRFYLVAATDRQDEDHLQSEMTIVIVGQTGSGKSSLANVLLGESPLCTNCTFPICSGLHSCTKQTYVSSGPWLGLAGGQIVRVVDTPGFGDSDGDDSILLDEMMAALKDNVGSANVILLLMKEGETRLGRELQQMVREMKAMFGEGMWNNLVVGVSFWSYQDNIVKFRQSMCQYGELNCRDEKWFVREMSSILREKFRFQTELPFVFIDSWAKHPLNIQDKNQQEVFSQEAEKLLKIGNRADPFPFRTVNDVLAENHVLKKRNAILEETINENIEKLSNQISQTEMNVVQMKTEIEANCTKRFKAVEKDIQYLTINLQAESSERKSFYLVGQNISSRLAVMENKIQHMKERMDRETSNLKQEQDMLKAASNTETNKLENDIIQMRGAMNQLPGKWSGGSYCILANGACPPGFARYQGHLYAIKMYSHLPQWVGKARFGDSFIQCHGTNCQYTNYAELRLTSCCK